MGTVHASSFGGISSAPAPPPLLQPSSSSPGEEMPQPMDPKDMASFLPEEFKNNPGTMEELHKKCKDIYPNAFEGGKFMLNKPITSHFQVTHSLTMSSSQPSGYKFGATYVGNNQVSPVESYPVLLGEMDPSGNLNANIIHQLHPNIRTKFVAQIENSKWLATQFTADYKRAKSTSSLTLGNLDVINNSGVAVFHHLHKINEKLDLGAELAIQYGPQIPSGKIAVGALAARYAGNNFVASGTAGLQGIHACYYQKCSENLQIGCELETSLRLQESTASIAYQAEIPKANFTFRSSLDTNWNVQSVFEKKLLPLPLTFALSMSHNISKGTFKLGIGGIIG